MSHQAFILSLLGATNQQLADFFHVRINVIESWLINNAEFSEARERGKTLADAKVAYALYKRACGYSYTDTLTITNREGMVIRTEVQTKHVPPDTQAALKWLALRDKDNWRDANRSEHTISYSGTIDITLLTEQLGDQNVFTDADLELALKLGLNQLKPYEGTSNN